MIASDGIQWDRQSNARYTTDVFYNAVYKLDMQGKLTLLSKNGDTNGINGELDAPNEMIVRGNNTNCI
ncbi:hypothetical protein DS885_15180, partial [Psychromonas sp. B3M02]